MSLTKDSGNIVFECDGKGCHETFESGTEDFAAALEAARAKGWHPRKPLGPKKWLHLCGGCFAQVFVTLKDGTVL